MFLIVAYFDGMNYVRRYGFVAMVIVAFSVAPGLQGAGMCTAEFATCEESGDLDPGQNTGGSSSSCKKCVMPLDGYAYCKVPEVYGPAGGYVVSNCQVYQQCYWAGWWDCFYTCSGNPCYWT
jgi:hypothetical protein